MRRAAYVGASVAAATAVILRAFHERPNFYSATVYLGQSTACRMILLNMLLLTLGTSMYGLQRLLYGPLRAIEIEQLWDKAWYAITETALAMTTFRDEVGGYFFLMFMTLLAGKVWGWIGEGRVETLEQQPPTNPKTFYTRLTTSLVVSEVFDLLMFRYCLQSILNQSPPRAGMMIMFVFEFAILAINSASTLSRYGLALWERWVIKKQTEAKIQERREELRAARTGSSQHDHSQGVERSDSRGESVDIDEDEIDVPGWQEKGKWILFLDLATDFLKLIFYMSFFMILILFAGIPIHMFRDLFITTRSFLKRINDYLKYRNATRDMNSRYPDATVDELQRDGTCIICREEMRPWQAPNQPEVVDANRISRNRSTPDERQRPKRLPCGHILHFGCLRSWLERQQVCPTCRRSVLVPDPSNPNPDRTAQNAPQANDGHGHGADEQNPRPQGQGANQAPPNQQPNADGGVPGINRMRTFNLGGFRLTLATGRGVNLRDAVNRMQNQAAQQPGHATNATTTNPVPRTQSPSSPEARIDVPASLSNVEQHIMQEINSLGMAQHELQVIRALQSELARLRSRRANGGQATAHHPMNPMNFGLPAPIVTQRAFSQAIWDPSLTLLPLGEHRTFESQDRSEVLHSGDQGLPSGMALPEGWSMLPLQRTDNGTRFEEVVRQLPRSEAALQFQSSLQAPSNESDAASQGQNDANISNHSSDSTNSPRAEEGGTTDGVTVSTPEMVNTSVGSSSKNSPIENTASTESVPIPEWSSEPADDGHSPTSSRAHSDKGKGRAVQVEDAAEDE